MNTEVTKIDNYLCLNKVYTLVRVEDGDQNNSGHSVEYGDKCYVLRFRKGVLGRCHFKGVDRLGSSHQGYNTFMIS